MFKKSIQHPILKITLSNESMKTLLNQIFCILHKLIENWFIENKKRNIFPYWYWQPIAFQLITKPSSLNDIVTILFLSADTYWKYFVHILDWKARSYSEILRIKSNIIWKNSITKYRFYLTKPNDIEKNSDLLYCSVESEESYLLIDLMLLPYN